MTEDMPSDNTDYMLHIFSYGVIEKMRERIVELDDFVKTGNELMVAVENENGKLREEVRLLRMRGGYD